VDEDMEISELQNEVGEWHRKTFKDAPDMEDRILAKLSEEECELSRAWVLGLDAELADEAADVAIVLLAFCARMGIDLEAEIQRKMLVNRNRTWKQVDGQCPKCDNLSEVNERHGIERRVVNWRNR
jgi:NTP pyrophosphatase (non-canonical NTP hydrolase)